MTWTTPNNVLHEHGLGELVGAELFLSFVLGGLLSFYVYRNRSSYKNGLLYWSSQLLTGVLFSLPVLLLIGLLLYAILFGIHV